MRPTATVPCGSCTLCCKSEAIILHPEHGDDPGNYETVAIEHPLKPGLPVYMIKPRDDGSLVCRYLGPFGCSIHAKRPTICREFDCRGLARREPEIRAKLKATGQLDMLSGMQPLIDRGRQLLGKNP